MNALNDITSRQLTRKGSASYCAAGTIAPPSQSSIDNRGGWSQGKIKDVYQHYIETGDEYVGRTVCGLPRHSVEFAILPPHFKTDCSNLFIRDCVNACFPGIECHLFLVAKFALASLVYHYDFLKTHLPKNHIIFETILFTSLPMYNELKSMVYCGQAQKDSLIVPTGKYKEKNIFYSFNCRLVLSALK